MWVYEKQKRRTSNIFFISSSEKMGVKIVEFLVTYFNTSFEVHV